VFNVVYKVGKWRQIMTMDKIMEEKVARRI